LGLPARGDEDEGARERRRARPGLGGRERDESRWRELLDATGFEVEAVHDLLVEARRS
jgi:hypothetical protein